MLYDDFDEDYVATKKSFRNFRTVSSLSAPKSSPTILDIAWAAGIYEGEGNLNTSSNLMVRVTQKDIWILDKFQNLFGGTISQTNKSPNVYHTWALSGVRARGFILTIFSFLSPRRKEKIINNSSYFLKSS